MPELHTLSLSRFLNFTWYMLIRNADEKGRSRLRARVWQPPKGVVPDERSPWSAKNETAAFKAFQMQATGKAPDAAS